MSGKSVISPMPAKVLKVNVNVGDVVKRGTVLFITEAMKMENRIMSPMDGTVAEICVTVDQSVNAGEKLAVIS
ncbi:MAG: biotin/lipoyl attachment protein [Sporomusa sp.]|jgi:biotin carboxyl carrier protein|nr:biotin/lipoyl attachment protein [Sporomusa sp.]